MKTATDNRAMSDQDPSIDPIEAFIWTFSKSLREIDPEGIKSAEITKRIHLALSTQDIIYLDQACRQAIMDDQRRLLGTPVPPKD